MALTPGTRLGPYEILASVGAGGMGEVYRATDTNLKRSVAIKVLPASVAADADRLARFQREAELLAALNHPNIAAIYGLEKTPDLTALVMELVEGEDLSAHIARGAVPLAETLPVARQIAEALEAAHEQGIVHRDLKPANIKVRADGTVKVLDFGLAKAFDSAQARASGAAGAAADAMNSPTLTAAAFAQGYGGPGTQVGMILGTAAYMAPEQARAKSVDKRADIWAFGVVVYEMLTGERAFKGDEISDVLAAVLRQDIDWAALPAGTPSRLRRLLARCLERDVKRRLRDIGEARVAIEELLSGPADHAVSVATSPRGTVSFLALGATAIASALAVGGTVWLVTRSAPVTPPLVEATILPPAAKTFALDLAVSDQHLAFVAGGDRQLFVRALASSEATPIAGATRVSREFFSPDGLWLGFYSSGDKRLKKVPVSGGPASEICEAAESEGSDWGSEGIVISERARGLSIVSPDSAPRLVLAPGTETFFTDPMWLPGGRSILYTEVGRVGTGGDDRSVAKVMMLSLAPGARPVKVADGYAGRFIAPHALVFERENTLLSVRFDPSSGATSSDRETVRTDVQTFAVSPNGTLVVHPLAGVEQLTFVWVDRQGHIEPTGIQPSAYRYPRISPDGTHIVVASSAGDFDLWIWDLGQKSLARLTTEKGADSYPVWTPDSRRVIYGGAKAGGDEHLMVRAADGTGEPQVLLSSNHHQTPYTISPDGAWVVFRDEVPNQTTKLGILDMRTHDAKLLLGTKFNERDAEISPDGHLMAYQSDETGRMEVYVRPFPNVNDGKRQISNGGGLRPVWSRDGRRLYYMTDDVLPATMDVVERKAGAALEFGASVIAFDLAPFEAQPLLGRTFDIGADGRFLMPKRTSDTSAQPGLTLFLNWAAHLDANR